MRRSFTIIAIVIVLAGIGAAAYFYVTNKQPSLAVTPTEPSALPAADEVPTGADEVSAPAPEPAPATVAPRLVQISKGPVVQGMVVVDIPAKNASSTPDIATSFIERQSGNVYSYLTRAGQLTRTSNRTVPGIQSADWLPSGSTAFVRYLSGADFSTINTYALPAISGTSGFFLPQDLSRIAVTSTGVLMLASGINGSVASMARTDGAGAKEVFSTPLSSLRTSFAGKSQYLAFTKPSGTLAGDVFIVDGAGHFSRIAGPLPGLVALASPSGKWVLVSYVAAGGLQMKLVNISTLESIPLPVATIADKCVWAADDTALYCGVPVNPSPNATYPDDWYQGTVSFSDRIWKIDVTGRFAQLILDFPKETDSSLDTVALAINPQATVLVFVNKNDQSLWSYRL